MSVDEIEESPELNSVPERARRPLAMALKKDAIGDPTGIGYMMKARDLGYDPEE